MAITWFPRVFNTGGVCGFSTRKKKRERGLNFQRGVSLPCGVLSPLWCPHIFKWNSPNDRGIRVKFCWIPSHVGIAANHDLADHAPKSDAEEAQAWTVEQDDSETTPEAPKKHLKQDLTHIRQRQWDVQTQGCHEIVATKCHDFSMTVSQNSMTSLWTYTSVGFWEGAVKRRWFVNSRNLFVKFHDFSTTFCSSLKIPWLFHDPVHIYYLVKIPWLFQKFQKIQDFSMTFSIESRKSNRTLLC